MLGLTKDNFGHSFVMSGCLFVLIGICCALRRRYCRVLFLARLPDRPVYRLFICIDHPQRNAVVAIILLLLDLVMTAWGHPGVTRTPRDLETGWLAAELQVAPNSF